LRQILRYLAFSSLFLVVIQSFSQQIPQTEVTTLTGTHVILPNEAKGKPLLLLLTFSHKGSDDLAAWNKRFKVSYATDPRIEYLELLDFQGVPPFVMKMILHGLRRSVHEPERSHFAPFYAQEEDWKKLVNYGDPRITYLVLSDRSGHVIWQTRGPASDGKAAELEAMIVKQQAHPD
jgi:hypothetical protein